MNKLRECRKKIGLSQKELADVLNLTQMQVSYYERGERSPRTDIAIRIFNFFKKKDRAITFMSLWDTKNKQTTK